MNPKESPAPTHLYLVRHGQAIVNVEPIIGGMRGDRGLTALGVEQARRLRDRLAATREIEADVLITSSLPRARQTAEILAPALGLPVLLDDEVQELRVGDEGDDLTLEEYKRRFGWVDLEADPFRTVDPHGESWATFMLRVAKALTRITREHAGKTIVVVCHGGVIDGSFLHFFGMNGLAVPPAGFYTQNTSITYWRRMPHHGRMRWILTRYNDDAHLRGLTQTANIDYTAEGATEPAEPAVPTEE
jgi:probable phosphoglycerate mutase